MKMKKMLAVLSALCMIGGAVPMLPVQETAVISASAEDSAELFNYSKNIKRISDEEPAESISISGVKDISVTEITIPAEIDGLPVTRISSHAFFRCSKLASVTIPESVIMIDRTAFSGTPWLKAKQEENPLVVVNGILIDASTCAEDVMIPDTVKSISNGAFEGSAVTSVTLPDNITDVSGSTFSGSALASVKVSENNPAFTSEDGILFSKDKTELIFYPPKSERTEYTIPDGVKCIQSSAFENCLNLTSVTIPDTITNVLGSAFSAIRYPLYINYYAFANTTQGISGHTFVNCLNLKEIHVSENNTGLSSENGILFNKDKTELISYPCGKEGDSYIIPDSVTVIQANAFSSCLLKEVTIPESVTSIGVLAFCSSSLTSVTIPKSVTKVGGLALAACPDLKTVTFENPECEIESTVDSIYNSYDRENVPAVLKFDGTIYGYEGSTAQAYAEKYSRNFAVIGSEPATTEPKTEDFKQGDADESGEIDILDVITINKAILGKENLTENGLKAIDFNGNGKPDAGEAQTLLKYIVGLITSFTE